MLHLSQTKLGRQERFLHVSIYTPPLTTRPLTKTEEAVFAQHDSGLPRTIQHSIFSHSKNLHLIRATRRTLYNFLNLFLSSQNAAPETPSKIGVSLLVVPRLSTFHSNNHLHESIPMHYFLHYQIITGLNRITTVTVLHPKISKKRHRECGETELKYKALLKNSY